MVPSSCHLQGKCPRGLEIAQWSPEQPQGCCYSCRPQGTSNSRSNLVTLTQLPGRDFTSWVSGTQWERGKSGVLGMAQPSQPGASPQRPAGTSVPPGPCTSKASCPSCPAGCHLHTQGWLMERVSQQSQPAQHLPCFAQPTPWGKQGHPQGPGSPWGKAPEV